MKVLIKILYYALILLGIYFALGLLASLGLIIMEANTNQLTNEIVKEQSDFENWIIYLGLSVFSIICVGISFVCFFCAKAIKKASRN